MRLHTAHTRPAIGRMSVCRKDDVAAASRTTRSPPSPRIPRLAAVSVSIGAAAARGGQTLPTCDRTERARLRRTGRDAAGQCAAYCTILQHTVCIDRSTHIPAGGYGRWQAAVKTRRMRHHSDGGETS